MRTERPKFVNTYEAVQVPRPLHLEKEPEKAAALIIVDEFFKEIETSLQLTHRTLTGCFEYDIVDVDLHYQKTFQRIGGQALASVLYVHNEGRQRLYFSKIPLRRETIDDIRAFQLLESIEWKAE